MGSGQEGYHREHKRSRSRKEEEEEENEKHVEEVEVEEEVEETEFSLFSEYSTRQFATIFKNFNTEASCHINIQNIYPFLYQGCKMEILDTLSITIASKKIIFLEKNLARE